MTITYNKKNPLEGLAATVMSETATELVVDTTLPPEIIDARLRALGWERAPASVPSPAPVPAVVESVDRAAPPTEQQVAARRLAVRAAKIAAGDIDG